MINQIPILTIDGPSGVGKGTVSKYIAAKHNWNLLDSGAIYRAFAYEINQKRIDFNDEQTLRTFAKDFQIDFIASPNEELVQVISNDIDISQLIRNEEAGKTASVIAAKGYVRDVLMEIQMGFAKEPGLVADGRDMGTVVFPNAKFKVFLDASAEERANRRVKQLQSKGEEAIISRILADIEERDHRDRSRKVSPLRAAEDAVVIDTSFMSIEEVLLQVSKIVEN